MSNAGLLAAAAMAMALTNEQSWRGSYNTHNLTLLEGQKRPTPSSGRRPTMKNDAKEKRVFKRKLKAKAAKKARRKNRRK